MVKKTAGHDSEAVLDFGKLLGFRRVVAFTGNDGSLAEALGASFNKVGAEVPPAPAMQLGVAFTKLGEAPV
jgi:hypothetical protein